MEVNCCQMKDFGSKTDRKMSVFHCFSSLHYDPHCHGIAEESTLSTLAEFAADSQLVTGL